MVWGYTLRQVTGYLRLIRANDKRERAMALATASLAARGDAKEIKKQLKELEK